MSKFLLLFLASYFGGLIVSLFTGAHWAFYVYELVYFLNPEKRWWSAASPLSNYSLISVIFLFIATLVFWQRNEYYKNRLFSIPASKWAALLLGCYALIYYVAVDTNLHLTASVEFLKLFVVIALGYRVLDTREKVNYAFYALIIGIAYLGYLAHSMGRDEYGRVGRFGMIDAPDVNVAAAAMIAALPLLIYYFWRGNWPQRIVMTLLGGIIVNGLVLANSRGAFLGGIVGVAYFVWEMYRSRFRVRFQRTTVIILVLLGCIAVLSVIDSLFIERMLTLTEIEDQDRSGSSRVKYWIISFDVLRNHPWGVGAFGYEVLSPQYVPAEYFDVGKNTKAVHSVWFQALTEAGYIGFVLYAMLILASIRQLYRVRNKCFRTGDIDGYYFTHAIMASFFGVLVASSFINQFRTQIIYWLVMFSACAFNICILRDRNMGKDRAIRSAGKGDKWTESQSSAVT